MKTTVDITDPLLKEARKVAAREGKTLRSLVEEGLRRVLADKKSASAFRLNLVTEGKGGLREELRGASWDQIRDLSYERENG